MNKNEGIGRSVTSLCSTCTDGTRVSVTCQHLCGRVCRVPPPPPSIAIHPVRDMCIPRVCLRSRCAMSPVNTVCRVSVYAVQLRRNTAATGINAFRTDLWEASRNRIRNRIDGVLSIRIYYRCLRVLLCRTYSLISQV
jgi:hypothetical protein